MAYAGVSWKLKKTQLIFYIELYKKNEVKISFTINSNENSSSVNHNPSNNMILITTGIVKENQIQNPK